MRKQNEREQAKIQDKISYLHLLKGLQKSRFGKADLPLHAVLINKRGRTAEKCLGFLPPILILNVSDFIPPGIGRATGVVHKLLGLCLSDSTDVGIPELLPHFGIHHLPNLGRREPGFVHSEVSDTSLEKQVHVWEFLGVLARCS